MVGPEAIYAKLIDQQIFKDWISLPVWTSALEDAKQVIELARHYDASFLVLDDYRIDESYQLSLRTAGLKWLQFDIAATNPLWADIIVNANPAVNAHDYTSVLRNQEVRLLLGPSHAVVRPDFSCVKRSTPRWPVKKILVTFGGGDDRGLIKFVLSSLVPLTHVDVEFVVISGSANPSNDLLRSWVNSFGQGRVSLHIDPRQIAPLFASCDLAIMAGGTTIYEAACIGLPMILISIVENQLHQSKAWAEMSAAVFLGNLPDISRQVLVNIFMDTLNDEQLCNALATRARRLSDGRGAHRVALCIDSMVSTDEQCF